MMQLSLVAPMMLGPSGADHHLRVVAQRDLGGHYYAERVTLAAPYVTIPMTGLVYAIASATGDCPVQRATSAMLFALTETVVLVGLQKWIFGRAWPTNGRDPYASDRLEHPHDAEVYRPLARGIDAAFPSGHTATMFAAAAALRAASPEWGVWRYIGYPIATAVGLGMWWGDHHWASDIVAGALQGEAIGGSAGRAWAPDSSPDTWSWALLPTQKGALLTVGGAY